MPPEDVKTEEAKETEKMTAKTTKEVIEKGIEIIIEHMPINEAILFLSEAKLGLGDYLKKKRETFEDMTIDEIIAEVKKFK